MEKFTSALNTLDSLSKSFEIFVPSLNRKVKFKGLNTKQQKDAVKSALEKATAGVSFSLLLNSILRENIQEPADLLLSDRSYIAVCLRVLSLSSTYKKEDETVNLDFVLNNNLPLPTELKTAEIVVDNIKITAAIPSLSRDNSINIESKKKLAPLPDNDDLPKEAVGELYINELTKYIDKVDINNNGNVVSIVFDELNLAQKTQLVEKLPLTINTKLIEFINSVKLFEKGYFTNNGKEVDINIDPSLFTV
jgi:hypothetical protein